MNRIEKVSAARLAATSGMVLLKNDGHALPLAAPASGVTVALLGATSYACHRMGFGSGDMLSQHVVQIDRGLADAGVRLAPAFAERYRRHLHDQAQAFARVNRDWGRWTFRFPEPDWSDDDFARLAAGLRPLPAIVTLGRSSGESVDLEDAPGSFRLHAEEETLLRQACANFDTVIVVLNVYGAMDPSFLDRHPVKAVLLAGLAGETTGSAVADVLTGAATPSGKLAATWAKSYADHPSADGFGTSEVAYREGIYVGYRYFDSFGVEPRFPFGFGLSYTTFAVAAGAPSAEGSRISLRATVENTGDRPGAEVVQVYLSAPDGKLEKAHQELCAFAKTPVLAPGGSVALDLSFDLEDFASYCEECASYLLEPGDYTIRVGVSSRDTRVAGRLRLPRRVVTLRTQNRLVAPDSLRVLSRRDAAGRASACETRDACDAPVVELDPEAFAARDVADPAATPPEPFRRRPGDTLATLRDVADGLATMEEFVAQFSNLELASCVNGILLDEAAPAEGAFAGGGGVGGVGDFHGKLRGEGSEFWHSGRYGIPANNCQDGPSGIRLAIFGEDPGLDTEAACLMVSYPSATLLAQTWDPALAEALGRCYASDMEVAGLDGWLGGGVNIQRNPLCGRNFEYPSEDPFLGGTIVGSLCRGVQTRKNGAPSGRYATMKHFAANNQEFERVGGNSLVRERALREIYLKAFQWCFRVGSPLAVMTSYNRINGEFAATSYDLLAAILRAEWGFDGVVMTDWWNGADPLRHCDAGGDVQMPGVRERRDAVLAALDAGAIDLAPVQVSAARVMRLILRTSFVQQAAPAVPAAAGPSTR
jgi:beta-glucosidase-like glycosyl hydrolase